MPIIYSIILGVVEGLTEYLPVSSTGHLILVAKGLGLAKSDATDAFEIVIQFGAILAVFVHYRHLLLSHAHGLVQKKPESIRLATSIAIGFLPIAILGKLFGHAIKQKLFAPIAVAIALALGGVLMIVVEQIRARNHVEGKDGLEFVTPRRAIVIAVGQCFALIPGTSRSMSTIVAGQLTGLSTRTAAEFSFLLGLPTLGVATLYEAFKSRHVLVHEIGLASIVIGLAISFIVAWGVIAAFLRYLVKNGLAPFGIYRIALGALILWLTLR